MIDYEQLINELKRDEGFSGDPYLDIEGNVTVGYGRNLASNPLSKTEAEYLLTSDLSNSRHLLSKYNWFNGLDPLRKRIIINMHYQHGHSGLMRYKRMIKALERNHYKEAATEMLDSVWARKHVNRATRLVKMMRTGEKVE